MALEQHFDAGRLGVRVAVSASLGNAVGALTVFAYQTFLPVGPASRLGGPQGPTALLIGAFAAYMGFAAVIGAARGVALGRPALLPLGSGRPLSRPERAALLTLPWRMTAMSFALWVGAAVFFGSFNRIYGTGAASFRIALGILLGGLVTCSAIFLSLERVLRPAVTVALEGSEPDEIGAFAQKGMLARVLRRRAGIGPRLFLLWALGSGAPLVGIALSPAGVPRSDQAELIVPIVVLSGIGLAAGGMVTAASARSLAEPLGELRRALARVERGDLSSGVTVSQPGQIGMLQAGFNRMIVGLRQRKDIEDLFGRHVGADVAREALEEALDGGGVRLGGERREVSVLFVDLVGSTALAQSLPPEKVVAALNGFFEVVVRVVAAEGGWVNKFEGDGALCIFGAPVAQADHAQRALRAARTLRRELLVIAGTGPAAIEGGLDAGIGVSSGSVVAGNVGSEERLEYTVVGDPVNEAARLTEEAKRRLGRVVASEETVSRAGEEGRRWMVAGELSLRGRTQTTLAYEPATTGD